MRTKKSPPEDPLIAAHGFPNNDYERAQLFVWKFHDQIKFTGDVWFTWNEQTRRWREGGEMEFAWKMLPVFENLALAIKDPDVSSKAFKAAKGFGNHTALENMLKQASRFKEVSCKRSLFDSDPWSLGVQNGVVDLTTGRLREGRREDYITKTMGCDFDVDADCPIWQQFLVRVFNGDEELIDLVWRAIGYSLTGLTTEQVLFFLYGMGQNGKSTFVGVLLDLFGDYGQKTKSQLFTKTKYSDEPETLIARLVGARFVVGAEIQAGVSLNAAMVKDLCGGDVLTGRRLYEDHINFTPTHKLFGYGNHRPTIHDTDHGIWRRIRLFPFEVQIPESERDPHLAEKMKAELPGILSWAITGCMAWREGGLGTANASAIAKEDYHLDEDEVGTFIAERCVLGAEHRIACSELYKEYRSWAEHEQGTPSFQILSAKLFANRLKRPGITNPKQGQGSKVDGKWAWNGIDLGENFKL
jgi:putative DNA primase/helicase